MSTDNQATSPQAPSPREAPTSAVRGGGASIGPKTQIKGDLQAEEDLSIEGQFSGTPILRGHQLSIGQQGRITGTAFAKNVIVDGHIEGDLYAVERISIRKGARVQGSILSPRVSLEDGATLRGSVEMDPKAIQEAIETKFGEQVRRSAETPTSETRTTPERPVTAPKPKEGPTLRDANTRRDAPAESPSPVAATAR